MVLSAQAQRNWRMAAILGSTFAGVYSIFFAEYELDGEPHIFSEIQASRKRYQEHLGGTAAQAGRRSQEEAASGPNETGVNEPRR